MRSSGECGFSALVLPLVITVVVLIGALIFGGWAFSRMQDYKNNVDTKIQAAVAVAKQQESAAKDAAFAQQEKYPFRTYTGPAAYGSVTIKYPKTWSAYVSDDSNSTPFVDGYFYPVTVPNTTSQSSVFALRVQIVQQTYAGVLSNVQDFVKQGKTTVSPYQAPLVPNVVGARIDGQLTFLKSGSMVIFPLRNVTLEIWTESSQFENDFNSNILPNFSFSP